MHEQIAFHGNSAVKVKLQEKPHFTYPWHFHSEYEIILMLKGEGTRFVANKVEQFGAGDLVLLGSNLPHFWKTDEHYYEEDEGKIIQYVVIQFSNLFFREEISSYPEFVGIKELLNRSAKGISFNADFAEEAKEKIMYLVNVDGFERTIKSLELLQYLSQTNRYKLLAGELYQSDNFNDNSDRFTRVMHFLNSNYLGKIELDEVASVANMHRSAFCRYFKEKTGKSVSTFVNDMRISYACQLLIEGKMTVSQIGFESGFNNLSNFNRIFKSCTSFTPRQYIQEFRKQ